VHGHAPAARIIDGRAAAARLRQRLADRTAGLKTASGLVPCLAVVLVGEDPASKIYVRNKIRHALEIGFDSRDFRLPGDVAEPELIARIEQLNADPAVDGILVQLPLPVSIDVARVLGAIDPAKDVDGLHAINSGRLIWGADGLLPCTPLGCMILIRETVEKLSGRTAVVVGRSALVGKPMALLLLAADCTVSVAHSKTRDLPELCRRAEILVAAVGRPELVRGDWIRPGATVIDVGINRVRRGESDVLVGDVAFEEASRVAGAITPVPGGVGPMTVACLLANTLQAFCRRHGIPAVPECLPINQNA
jgi:methylenetetrahydrofolate dehydrogenase (NADP+) / methenyltetrahydrofolate cyclohydrolase